MRGLGRAPLAARLLLMAGTLNIIYGIGALDDANIFVNDTAVHLHQPQHPGLGADPPRRAPAHRRFSLMSGNTYGRVIGIVAGSLGAIGALLSIGGAYPWWSLGIFFLCIYVVYGIFVFGGDDETVARA